MMHIRSLAKGSITKGRLSFISRIPVRGGVFFILYFPDFFGNFLFIEIIIHCAGLEIFNFKKQLKNKIKKLRLIVIGGGAAGFFCAVNAARMNPKLEVILVEKSNKLLSKVRISGGGRCNVTHACFSIPEMV